MVLGNDNQFFDRGQSPPCSSKAECGGDLKHSSINSEDDSLSVGARTKCWDHSYCEIQEMGQFMADIWQFTLALVIMHRK